MKKPSKRLTAAKLARTMARARIGAVHSATVVPDARKRPPKHKQDLAKNPPEE